MVWPLLPKRFFHDCLLQPDYTRITPACFHSRVQRVRMPGAPGIIRPAAVSWTDAAGAAVHMAQAASGAIPKV